VSNRPYVIGITGTIGSGKSAVGGVLEAAGVPIIDSDKVVHELFEESEALRTAIQNRFGDSVISNSNGIEKVDRAALGQIVFNDADARKSLEAIVHPATIAECRRRIEAFGEKNDIVAVLVPLLFEAGLEKQYDEIWAIYADPETLKQRLQARDNLSLQDVERRLAAQLPQDEKRSRSDFAIDNSGTLAETAAQVTSLLKDASKRFGAQGRGSKSN
jgi:dephospho-CoA kinase